MAREAGARRVIFASAAPPVKYPNVYGIDMPTRSELIAYGRTVDEICREITADALVYQDLPDLHRSVFDVQPKLTSLDASCFNGQYVTGDVDAEYLDRIEMMRHSSPPTAEDAERSQLHLNLAEDD